MYTPKSLLGNIWKIKDFDERESLMISQNYKLSPLLAKLLNIRKISKDYIELYLKPDLNAFLPDPYALKDMKKSVERIVQSIIKNEVIGIIADYDVDGSTSAAILSKFLLSINQKYILKIPDRLVDGYGPNEKILNELLIEKINLLIVLDCGTTSFKLFNNTKYYAFDTIIIDHHISENFFPKVYSIINPNRFDENNDYKDLAAVGVTYLFLLALRKQLREINYFSQNNIKEPNLLNILDLVALGTVCDVVSLQKYNRSFVKNGIEILHKRKNKGIAAIIDNSRINHSPTVSDLGFVIGPQLNAASRIEDSSLSSKLLISENIIEIESISRKLLILNEKRKLIEKKILEEAYKQAVLQSQNNIIIVYGDNWHKGVLGIVASRLVDLFNKPAIVVSFIQNKGIGSARSLYSIDLGQIIMQAKSEKLLINGGGHKMAAGFEINKNQFINFKKYINVIFERYDSSYFIKIIYYDSILSPEAINLDLLECIEKLEPFGNNNPEPKFVIKDIFIDFTKIINEKHILLNLRNKENLELKAICFNCINNSLGQNFLNNKSNKYDFGCSIVKDIYQGRSKPQLIIHDALVVN